MEKLVAVFRGTLEESSHYGHVAVVNIQGKILSSLGNPDYLTYIRSAAKPLQVIPLLLDGLDREFGFTGTELAVMCGSHGGEAIHRQAVASILKKIGLDCSYLQCGTHQPFSRAERKRLLELGEKPTSLHNNCSGKHAAMLTLSAKHGFDLSTYLNPEHPVQQRMLDTVAALSQFDRDQIITGVDGCGVPVFGLPLSGMALAYANLSNPGRLPEQYQSACEKICHVMSRHPEMVSATGALDHCLMATAAGRLIAKSGAEAVYCLGVPGRNYGIALKIIDGNQRAVPPAVVTLLYQLGVLTESDVGQLKQFSQPSLKNNRGDIIGHLEAALTIPPVK